MNGAMIRRMLAPLRRSARDGMVPGLQLISLRVVAGGYFFGTLPDGKRVLAGLNRGGQLESPMLTLAAETFCDRALCAEQRGGKAGTPCDDHGRPPPAPFGSAYTCAIGDTVTAGAAYRPAAGLLACNSPSKSQVLACVLQKQS